MKNIAVIILISISACKHQTPTEKAKDIVIKFLDSTHHQFMISNVNKNFTQKTKYMFSCEYVDYNKEGPEYSRADFTLDSTLSKVTEVSELIH